MNEEHELAARVVSALLRENYGGLTAHVTKHVTKHVTQATLRLPGRDEPLPLEPDGFGADYRVAPQATLTLDEVETAVAALAGTRDAAGAAAFDAECRRTLAETNLRALAARRPRPDENYDALAAALPHPLYPASPCRFGLTDGDVLAYAPEFSPGFELRWAALPERLVTSTIGEPPAWWPDPEQVGLETAEAHELFPVHPLSFRREAALALVAAGATLAPRPYLEVRPTLSVRTVAVAGHPDHHVKLPLPISTLGLRNRRFIAPGTLADGALTGRTLERVVASDGALKQQLLLADDTRYAHAGQPNLGYLLRRLPPGVDGENVVPVAALTARGVFEELAGPGNVLDLADEYFRLVFGVATRLLVRHGIALESHQQNAALVITPGQRLKLLVKDFDGALLNPDRLPEAAPEEFTDRRLLTGDDEALADVFVTITVHLCVGAVAFGLARAGVAKLEDLLAIARRALKDALDAEGDAPAAKLLRVRVLEADRLTGKSMITAGTLTAKEHTGAADVNKYYATSGPNYLKEAR